VDNLQYGEVTKIHRKRLGMSQKQLADMSNLSVRAIRNLERGITRHPRKDTRRLIAGALRLSEVQKSHLEQLAGEEETRLDPAAPRPFGDTGVSAPLTALIGRSGERSVLASNLLSGHHRLITITGLSGVGKTHLAQSVALDQRTEHGASVTWVAEGPDDAGAGGRRFSLAEPKDELNPVVHEATSELKSRIGTRRALLVIDDPALPLTEDSVGVDLLRECPGLQLLVTAREPARIAGESVFPLTPLPVPRHSELGVGELTRVPAVELLVACIRRHTPRFVVTEEDARFVASVCIRLDGIPAALVAIAPHFALQSAGSVSRRLRLGPHVPEAAGGDDERAPAGVAAGPGEASPGELTRQLLGELARAADWSIDDAATLAGTSRREAEPVIRELLLSGLVTQKRTSSGPGFSLVAASSRMFA
jgi:transcriptional regulator with XRE-family HTH domain